MHCVALKEQTEDPAAQTTENFMDTLITGSGKVKKSMAMHFFYPYSLLGPSPTC